MAMKKDPPVPLTGGTRGSSNEGGPDPGAQPRGPLPEGANVEDYVGGRKPHKTRARGGTRGASGQRRELP
jgi:hypothetical protein